MRSSYYEATSRQRVLGLVDAGTFEEWIPPQMRAVSPHLARLGLPQSFDDGVVVGRGKIDGKSIFIASQEGGFMGGAVGEIHGAKILGVLERARQDRPAAVVLLLDCGGVRLQEANAGLIAVSEIIRAILAARIAGIPVIGVIGGQYGCFGGMGIAARCVTSLLMSEEARLGLSGPEVIETANGVDEYDSRDRALVWRTVGGKHRYLLRECDALVADSMEGMRRAIMAAAAVPDLFGIEEVEREHEMLRQRIQRFGDCSDGAEIWRMLGWPDPESISILPPESFVEAALGRRAGGGT
jgi:malonate decarboxylase beta subunit